MDNLDVKLNQSFAGKVVRKDLTKQIKEGAFNLEEKFGSCAEIITFK